MPSNAMTDIFFEYYINSKTTNKAQQQLQTDACKRCDKEQKLNGGKKVQHTIPIV